MLSVKALNTKIRSVARRNATLREDIQLIMCNIAGYAYRDGNVSAATNLLNAVVGQDKVAIVRFLHDHCFVNVKKDGTVSLNKKAKKECDFDSAESLVAHLIGNAPKWYESAVSNGQAAAALDPAARIRALAKQVQSGDRDVKHDMADLELAMRELVGAMAAARRGNIEPEAVAA
jgi:hypothetical protein